ncbi:serine/threonine protein kinase [Tahibacter amnicola]|uniref:Protein kinase n=1 Tax=Tahibacter amnicola TaxID=2976241 RepID=A0ABY6BHV1_9GAMM|nr:serine/threonine-protein kinase [Tahibacter amnicola]UXI69369.1 protein kinase [Tahibacter amnicola]
MPQTPVKIPGYEFLRQLGAGGMSTVWLAMQVSLQRKIAIKVMRRAHEASSTDVRQFEKRFLLEGRTMAKLPHRNIVAVYDIVSNEDVSYIAMEFLEGGTLSEKMQSGLSLSDAISVVVQIAGALDFAHNQGIVHRDLKPANIMFRDAATPVLTDFGIARQQDQSATRLTQTGMLVGTPNYMSPEQISGGDIDGRSDLYSLGVMFFELLSGRTPFTGDTPIAVMMAHLTQAPPPLAPEFAHFQPILDRMLAKNRDDRFASMHDFVAALKQQVINSDTLLMKLQLDPNLTSSEQLRQLGFSHSDPSGGSWRSLGAIPGSGQLPRPSSTSREAPSPLPRPGQASQRVSAPSRPTAPPPSRQPRAAPAPPAAPPRWPWVAVIAMAVAIAIGVGLWQWQSGGSRLSADEQELVRLWMKDAERLAAERKYVTPPGDNAYEIMQKVLQKDPQNEMAQKLQETMVVGMRTDALAAFAKGELAAAQERIDQALLVRKDDEESVAFKAKVDAAIAEGEKRKQQAQLFAGVAAAEKAGRLFGPDGAYALLLRARDLIPGDAVAAKRLEDFISAQLVPARQALANKEVARAKQLLDALREHLGEDIAFTRLAAEVENQEKAAERERQLVGLLDRAETQLAGEHLAEPAGANAYETLGLAREVAATDARVLAFAKKLAAALVADGRKVAAGAPQRALERADLALRVEPGRTDAAALKQEIEQRLGQRLADIGKALSSAKQALVEQRYIAPADNNARQFLDKVLTLDPGNAEAHQLLVELPRRLAESIDAKAAARDTTAAMAMAREAHLAFPDDVALKALVAKVEKQAMAERAEAEVAAARERIAAAIRATPVTGEALTQAARNLSALLAANPADRAALELRAQVAQVLAATLRSARTLSAFDEFAAVAKNNDKLLASEPAYQALIQEAAALRQGVADAEQARLASLQGELVLNAQPWAKVESVLDVERKPVTLPEDPSTPFMLKLPAGNYVITFRHPQSAKPVTVIAKVEAQRRATANAAFPTISAEDYFTRAGW